MPTARKCSGLQGLYNTPPPPGSSSPGNEGLPRSFPGSPFPTRHGRVPGWPDRNLPSLEIWATPPVSCKQFSAQHPLPCFLRGQDRRGDVFPEHRSAGRSAWRGPCHRALHDSKDTLRLSRGGGSSSPLRALSAAVHLRSRPAARVRLGGGQGAGRSGPGPCEAGGGGLHQVSARQGSG